MNEFEQLKILRMQSAFWEDDHCTSNTCGSTQVGVIADGSSIKWKANWPDRTESVSPESFRSIKTAKQDLREFLDKRFKDQLSAVTGPAEMLFR